MKVLFINTNENYGGAARAAYRIMRGVQRVGVEVQMFVKNRGSRAEDVHTIWDYVPTNPFFKAFDWIVQKIKNQWFHYKWHPYNHTKQDVFLSDMRSMYCHGALQNLDYDIVHMHWVNQRFLDLRELTKIHKPIVWTLHDSWPFCGVCHYFRSCEKYQTHCGACPMLGSKDERDLAYEVFEKKASIYRNLNIHIVTPSRWLGECAKSSTLFGQFSVTIIPNGLDTQLFHPYTNLEKDAILNSDDKGFQTIKSFEHNKPYILFGAMNAAKDKLKGYLSLLAAMKILDAQGLDAHLIVFGANAEELPMRFEHIDVTFLGYIRDNVNLAALYSIADVMVVPSFSEVFGQTASEAMACGTPVVAFRCTGIQDVVEEGCGYLAEPYSTEDLANGIRYCIEHNPDNILGKAARESAVRRYSIDVVADQYKRLYESLV